MKKLRYFIETCTLKALASSLRRLPHHGVLLFARLTGILAYICDVRGRSTALENLRVAFRDELSWTECHRITCLSYQNFARTFFDLFWASTLTAESWREHVIVQQDNPEEVAETFQKGGIWITPHYGNFEFSGLFFGWLGYRFPIVAQDFKNSSLTEIFTEAREASGHYVISSQSAVLRLTKALARGGHAAFLTDLNVKPGRAATVIECFGLKTCVTTMHVILAQRFGLAVHPVLCEPLDDGRYIHHIFAKLSLIPNESAQSLAQRCWDVFETEIRRRPELWMWMYKHWRYLPEEECKAAYPSYANTNKEFNKLLRSLTTTTPA